MANTPNANVRVDRDLVDAVRRVHGLPADSTLSVVIRVALAVAVGRDASTAYLPIGRPVRDRGRTA